MTESLKNNVSQAKSTLGSGENESDSTSSSYSEDENKSEKSVFEAGLDKRCMRPLKASVKMLMDLLPTLEHKYKDLHTTFNRRQLLLCQQDISITPAALPYINVVRDKFPNASKRLVERLGEANWQRHENLRSMSTLEAPQRATSLFKPESIFKDSALGSSLPATSQWARSNASHSSFASSNDGAGEDRFRVPKIPATTSYGESFLCPYCKISVAVRDRVDWK